MNRYDFAIENPGGDTARMRVTRSGDIALTANEDSVLQRAVLAAATAPGELLGSPDFGAGAEQVAGLPATVAAARLAAAWRASLLADDRVTAAVVEAKVTPELTTLTARISTRADIPVTVRYEV